MSNTLDTGDEKKKIAVGLAIRVDVNTCRYESPYKVVLVGDSIFCCPDDVAWLDDRNVLLVRGVEFGLAPKLNILLNQPLGNKLRLAVAIGVGPERPQRISHARVFGVVGIREFAS
jgi:hypothetical protein